MIRYFCDRCDSEIKDFKTDENGFTKKMRYNIYRKVKEYDGIVNGKQCYKRTVMCQLCWNKFEKNFLEFMTKGKLEQKK